jgi:hypothetical protein
MRGLRSVACLVVAASVCASASGAQPLIGDPDRIATKLLDHYRTNSCAELDKERKKPKSAVHSRVVQRIAEKLRQDAQLRAAFLNRVAVPVADKMLVCGFIP